MTQNNPTLGRLLLIISFGWIAVVAFGTQFVAWAAPVFGIQGSPTVAAALLTALEAGLIAGPLLLSSRLLPRSRWRAALECWALAALVPLALAPTRLIAPAESQTLLLAQVAVLLVLAALFWRQRVAAVMHAESLALAAACGALLALPWLANGALGSLLDMVLALAGGLLAGVIAAQIGERWVREAESASLSRGGVIWRGGFIVGMVLLIIASGLAANGVQLLLMVAVPAAGWAVVALGYGRDGRNWQAPALLAGLALAAPLALLDTDSIGIVALDPALGQGYFAALLAVGIGWLLAAAALVWRGRWSQTPRVLPWLAGAALVWAGAAVLYFASGTPGLYGDRLFVILKDQADVSQASTITNYDERRTFVYRTLAEHATTTQADLRAHLARFGIAAKPYYLVNAVEVPGGILPRLLLVGRGEIDRIIPSPVLRPIDQLPQSEGGGGAAPTEPQWNLTNIRADRVWQDFGARGQGIVIGQSDSGVQWNHPELRDGYRGANGDHNYNWFDPWTGTTAPVDGGGHGTHTLGSVLGNSVGVAPDATWFACANLQRNIGNPALYLDCMQFMLAPHPFGGDPLRDGDPLRSANVLNNSWGCPQEFEGCDPVSLQAAVDNLTAAGIFVVASAGNEGPACNTVAAPIAIYENAFSVGAIDANNDLASFSSVGPVTVDGSGRIKPDIVAPGVDVYSSLPGNGYGGNSGTSMAGPHVAGVVALIWSANPALIGDIARTRQLLQDTAAPFTGEIADSLGSTSGDACLVQLGLGPRPNPIAGYGIVDAYAAVKAAIALR